MPYFIIRGDITKLNVDCIVNAANNSLLGGGGVDGAIHAAAGRELLAECRTLGGCETGDAKITYGYNLPAQFVIHTVGPIWHGGASGEEELLASCYRKSLAIAKANELESIAFPLISAGVYGYPKEDALRVASREIRAFLAENEMTVYMVIFGDGTITPSPDSPLDTYIQGILSQVDKVGAAPAPIRAKAGQTMRAFALPEAEECAAAREASSLSDMLDKLDMSFSEMLFMLIDERGMTDAECYRAANLDRRLFSKIRTDRDYHPSKATCIALCIALHLSLEQTIVLLRTAGYTLSHSSKFDVIIEYFITNGIYDIYAINDALFRYDQVLLGQ